MARDRLTGGGFASFLEPSFQMYAPEPGRVHDSHSIYFQVLGHHGFIGLALFVLLLGLTWLKAGKVARLVRDDPDSLWAAQLGRMVQVSLAAYMVGGAFLGLAYFDYLYHLIGLVVVTYDLVRRNPRPLADAAAAGQGPWSRPGLPATR
jgi:probable O-glycosylation ligase (exosortase A-associated)